MGQTRKHDWSKGLNRCDIYSAYSLNIHLNSYLAAVSVGRVRGQNIATHFTNFCSHGEYVTSSHPRCWQMSLPSILQQIKKKGQIPQRSNPTKPIHNDPTPSRNTVRSESPREIDPVVAKLKAARKAEKEKKEQELREKKGLPPKKVKQARSPRPAKANPAKSKTPAKQERPVEPIRRPPTKKLNFKELINKASKVDTSKLSIELKPKAKSPVAPPIPKHRQPTTARAPTQPKSRPVYRPANHNHRPKPNSERRELKPATRAPIPTRKPSSKLEEKLKNKTSVRSRNPDRYQGSGDEMEEELDDDDDLDSFIASDEEEEQQYRRDTEPDYDRDEIWAMFNKGKKRSYYERYDEYDSDDMEATGAEIFEEEQRSKNRAIVEDRKELEEEQRLAALKRARKKKSQH